MPHINAQQPGTPAQLDLARRLVASARAIGEPCNGAGCWLDLRDEFRGMTETQAKAIIAAILNDSGER